MVFEISRKICEAYWRDEFQSVIVYGPFGIGKSVYSIKVLAEVLNDLKSPVPYNIDELKKYLFFHPQDFVVKLMKTKERLKMIIWDDAGYWLSAYDWNEPFVRAVQKYFNVVRTHFGGIIFTTPLPTWITKKLRGLPQSLNVKIVRAMSSEGPPSQRNARMAKVYRGWLSPDMKKSGVRLIAQDTFNVMLPKHIYEWYKPIRDKYANEAIMLMYDELKRLRAGKAKKKEEI